MNSISVFHNSPKSQYFPVNNFINLGRTLSFNETNVLGYLYRYEVYYKDVYMAQLKISKQLNISLSTVKRCIDTLKAYKFLRVIPPKKFMGTCSYILDTFFKDKSIRSMICGVFTFLQKRFSLSTYLRFNLYYSGELQILTPLSYYLSSYLDCYIYPRNYPCKPVDCKTRARTYMRDGGYKNKKRVENASNNQTGNEAMTEYYITPAIKSANKLLNLTTAGILKLTAFPDKAIEYGIQKVQQGRGMKYPYDCLIGEAKKYCDINGIKPNWRKYYSLKEQLPIDECNKMVEDRPIPQRQGTGINKSKEERVTKEERIVFVKREIVAYQVIIDEGLVRDVSINSQDLWSYAKIAQAKLQAELDELLGTPKQQQNSSTWYYIPKGDGISLEDKLESLRSNLSKLKSN